ncbi:MAG: SPOR domain-containing protein [Spirochaetes bacterium]|nr:SPOR domain-containing protein [Spirochaetota bacterium]
MPLETKKVLWTVLSVVIVLVVASGIALALVYPRGTTAGAPATIAAVAPPRSASPDEYLRAVEPAPAPPSPAEQASPAGSDIIVVYGEKPDAATLPGSPPSAGSAAGTPASGTASEAAAATATSVGAPGSGQKPYVPAPATPVASSSAKPAPKTAPKPSAPKTVAEYWIQAAAFTSRSRADDLQRSLAGKGLSTLITVKDLDGVTWYRVRIGPYPSEREAKGWLEKIRVVAGCAEAYVSKQTIQRSS